MKEFEASTQNVFWQEAQRLLIRCSLALHNGAKALSQRAKMVERIEPILKLRTQGQNVVDPEVRGHLHDMSFTLTDIEDSLTRLQLDVSAFAWRTGLIADRLRGLKLESKMLYKCCKGGIQNANKTNKTHKRAKAQRKRI